MENTFSAFACMSMSLSDSVSVFSDYQRPRDGKKFSQGGADGISDRMQHLLMSAKK